MKKTLTLLLALWVTLAATVASADSLTCWFPPDWKDNQAKAKTITDALSANAGMTIRPRIAKDYPEILSAFATREPNLVYAGSFVQTIIFARKLGAPIVQSADGKEMYSGILICPKDRKPEDVLKQQRIAFARGASSGESTAKAATGGKAALAVASHGEAVKAVLDGKAEGAVVKDWWWLKNEANYANLKSYRIPTLSEQRNPDNVLAASGAVPKATVEKLTMAAMASSAAFGQQSVVLPFTADQLSFSLGLMKKGGIDPLTYSW